MRVKKSYIFILLSVSLSSFVVTLASGQDRPFSKEARQKAEALLKQMTWDEKIGQLNEPSGIIMPGLSEQKPDESIVQGKVGSILWLNDVKEINRCLFDRKVPEPGFERVALQPGETKTLTFSLGKNELQFWGPQQKQ